MEQKVDAGGAENEEKSSPTPSTTRAVNHATHWVKNVGRSVDFVQNDKPTCLTREIELRLVELCKVCWRLQIEVNGLSSVSDVEGECRLSDLPRANDRDSGLSGQRAFNFGTGEPGNILACLK